MASKPRVYLDACCYIDVAKGRLNAPIQPGEEDRDEQAWFIETLLAAASNGDVESSTSNKTKGRSANP